MWNVRAENLPVSKNLDPVRMSEKNSRDQQVPSASGISPTFSFPTKTGTPASARDLLFVILPAFGQPFTCALRLVISAAICSWTFWPSVLEECRTLGIITQSNGREKESSGIELGKTEFYFALGAICINLLPYIFTCLMFLVCNTYLPVSSLPIKRVFLYLHLSESHACLKKYTVFWLIICVVLYVHQKFFSGEFVFDLLMLKLVYPIGKLILSWKKFGS